MKRVDVILSGTWGNNNVKPHCFAEVSEAAAVSKLAATGSTIPAPTIGPAATSTVRVVFRDVAIVPG